MARKPDRIRESEAAQPEKLGDAGGFKFASKPTPPEPILESREGYLEENNLIN